MLRPAIGEQLKEDQSIFSLVIAIAKRAREVTDEIEEEKRILMGQNGGKLPAELPKDLAYLNTKPVKIAVEEFAKGDFDFKMRTNTQ